MNITIDFFQNQIIYTIFLNFIGFKKNQLKTCNLYIKNF